MINETAQKPPEKIIEVKSAFDLYWKPVNEKLKSNFFDWKECEKISILEIFSSTFFLWK